MCLQITIFALQSVRTLYRKTVATNHKKDANEIKSHRYFILLIELYAFVLFMIESGKFYSNENKMRRGRALWRDILSFLVCCYGFQTPFIKNKEHRENVDAFFCVPLVERQDNIGISCGCVYKPKNIHVIS